MHSATKYLGGHSDCLGGTLAVADPELYDRLYFMQNATGAVLDPMSCFLVARGLKTLDLRVREQCRTALRLAAGWRSIQACGGSSIPACRRIRGHDLAKRQFQDGFGAMLSFELDGDFQQTARVCEATKLFHLAVSLGAVESLIEQPASMSHASYDAADRARFGITDGLIRLSVGLEAFEDLADDLQSATRGGLVSRRPSRQRLTGATRHRNPTRQRVDDTNSQILTRRVSEWMTPILASQPAVSASGSLRHGGPRWQSPPR